MTQRQPTAVVVGASVAGVSAVRALRAGGFDGRLVLLGAEHHLPYDRPPLSKEFLAGKVDVAGFPLLTEAELVELEVDWRPAEAATGLRPAERAVQIAGGDIRADYVVIATGAAPRQLPGTDALAGVHVLRTLTDALSLRSELLPGARLVVVGAGFIGAEVASTARGLGLDVRVVEVLPVPLAAVLGEQMGALCAGLHARNGVQLRCGVGVAALHGGQRVREVELSDGSRLPADVVVVGIGALPVTQWLAGSGLELSGGVRCDAAGQTSLPPVVAVGDVARAHSPWTGGPTRVEHWTNALQQPERAVAALLGLPVPPAPPPYFWSEQYGRRIQFAGHARPDDEVRVIDGEPADGSFLALYERDGQPTAVLGVDQGKAFTRWRRQLQPGGAPVSA